MFSHQNDFLPSYGLEAIVTDSDMIFSIQTVGTQRQSYHKSFDYIYRPKELQDLNPSYEYYESVTTIQKSAPIDVS